MTLYLETGTRTLPPLYNRESDVIADSSGILCFCEFSTQSYVRQLQLYVIINQKLSNYIAKWEN